MVKGFMRSLSLNRLGAGLLVAAVLLLACGASVLAVTSQTDGPPTLWVFGLTGGQAVLLGLACFVFSVLVFGLAILKEQLSRIEAKVDAAARARESN